jgi:hypothetical protein
MIDREHDGAGEQSDSKYAQYSEMQTLCTDVCRGNRTTPKEGDGK